MNVAPISCLNFSARKTVFRLPLRSGETAKISIVEAEQSNEAVIKKIAYEIWHKGKITQADEISKKQGLDPADVASVMTSFNKRAKEGFEFFREYSRACVASWK